MTEVEAAALAIETICKPKRKPQTRRGSRPETFVRLGEEAFEFATSKVWHRFTPRHLVAFWAKLHGRVYGVDPCAELAGKAGLAATGMARAFVENQFGGDMAEAVEFLRWTWKRERSREDYRRANGGKGGRIGWRLQFSATLVTDYRIDLARRVERAPCVA